MKNDVYEKKASEMGEICEIKKKEWKYLRKTYIRLSNTVKK